MLFNLRSINRSTVEVTLDRASIGCVRTQSLPPKQDGTVVAPMKYGRDEADWDILAKEGEDFLIEKARSGEYTNYSEMNDKLVRQTGLRRFDFTSAADRAAMGYLLGLIVIDRNLPVTKAMISSLVLYRDGSDAGSGFYGLAQDLGLLPPGRLAADVKDAFWIEQVKAIRAHYQRAL